MDCENLVFSAGKCSLCFPYIPLALRRIYIANEPVPDFQQERNVAHVLTSQNKIIHSATGAHKF